MSFVCRFHLVKYILDFHHVSAVSRFVLPPLSRNFITEYYVVFIVVSHVCLCDGNHGHH